mmetsp:Transcript_4031/g.9775  ORF Transcript_4031/g.9775 Transcript_4031/m.9775 type:complete len:236 (+) Transcript_4031:518-1225(+)
MAQTNALLRAEYVASPASHVTWGCPHPGGKGIDIVTFASSMPARTSSYSSVHSHVPSPATDGQQLTVIGTIEASVVCKRHLSTPSALPGGKERLGSLSPRIDESAKSCLLMLGCVLNWKPAFSPNDTATLSLPTAGFETSSCKSPFTSRLCTPPSRPSTATTFSSTFSCSAPDAAAAAATPVAAAMGRAPGTGEGTMAPSLAMAAIKSTFVFFLPSCMPPPALSDFVGNEAMLLA